MKLTPLISVIIGTFNRANLFPRAVRSVLKQTYQNFEIILVDDASTDDTFDIAQKINDQRFTYIRHEENKGIATVSNRGFNVSSGTFIALLGDDDEWIDSKKLEKQIECFKRDKYRKLGIVSTWWEENIGNNITKKCPKPPKNWPERMLMGGGIVGGSTALVARSAWIAVDGFDERQKRGTDSDLFRRIVLSGYEIEIIEEITVRAYTTHGKERMTPMQSISAIDTHIDTLKYNINKLNNYYLNYPKALSVYSENIGWSYLKSYNMKKEKYRLKNAKKFLWKAFIVYPFRLKPLVKLILLFNRTIFFVAISIKKFILILHKKLFN